MIESQIKQFPSPNYDARKEANNENEEIKWIILHGTWMENFSAALARLCDREANVSSHYAIDRNGMCYQLVAEQHRAWHAGVSYWQGETQLNAQSIGIELDNDGTQPYSDQQIERLIILLHDLIARYKLSGDAILAHSDIAPDRKDDPGGQFPWDLLAAEGLGIWPPYQNYWNKAYCDQLSPQLLKKELDDALDKIGYDPHAKYKITAFQRHFCPDNITNEADSKTLILARRILSR